MADLFELDARLAGDTHRLARWPLCDVLLMDDARHPWLILMPRIAGARELIDLEEADRLQLWREIDAASLAMRDAFAPEKLNIGALGNVVSQLHIHVIARYTHDDAWPAPVWGAHPRQPRDADARSAITARILSALPRFAFEESR